MNNLRATGEALKSGVGDLPPQVLDKALANLKCIVSPEGKMFEEMWKKAGDALLLGSTIKSAIPTFEGVLWTSKYLT